MEHEEIIAELMHFLLKEVNVDIPTFYHKQPNAARLDFDVMDDLEARVLAKSALHYLFANKELWICAYGHNSGRIFKTNHFFNHQHETIVAPYRSCIDEDFEYEHETIACSKVAFEEFAVDRYLDYAFRLLFLSNTLVLVSLERKVAVYIYDRRGMDVVTTDAILIHKFRQHFQQYLYQS